MIRLRLTIAALAVVAAPAGGSVDEFQCTCAYNAQHHMTRVRWMLSVGLRDREAAEYAASYGPLASRMLLVAHGRPDAAPTADWLWLLNLFTNTVAERPETDDLDRLALTEGADRVNGVLDRYARICWARRIATPSAGWSQQTFEKFVLENMTSIVRQRRPQSPDDGAALNEADFRPRWLYLNDVVTAADGLDKLLAPDVGIDWGSTATRLRHLYELASNRWMSGTGELVLYQREVVSTVAASMVGFASVHVSLCRDYWGSAPPADEAAGDSGPVPEYSRVWMSVDGLLRSFGSYLQVDSEKYFRALLDVAADPALDETGFRRTRLTIETSMSDVGRGHVGVRRIEPRRVAAAAAAAAAVGAAAGAADDKEHRLNELIALVDNNISSAEKYLKTVQDLLSGVDFKIVNDFMRSTHIWLT